ncbi:strumpellin [Achlya hypogyna]|uniref:Strumpellin n=1 Tax=Achlya hypogyna TaxID=1202772 RepID=A0A1V9Z839_ACHHY|nr:strumpellin [Achlya hypogyna]
MEFLAEENECGQTLLRLVSRGSAIIAELFRLSNNIPGIFLGSAFVEDPEQRKYLDILFDFAYLKNPEEFETAVNSNTELLDIDDEFMDNHEEILDRFYQLFDSIYKYIKDYLDFCENLEKGFFIQHDLANIVLDTDGAQLMCESLYLYGCMLLLLDQKIPGPARERMVIAFYRNKGESALENLDEVCKLCRVTGYLPGMAKPPQYPERFFKRFAPPEEVVNTVISKLQTDDVYLQEPAFPHRDHRSTRLAAQASALYVVLYFAPDILIHEKASMREIVDRHFNDNFILATYMGTVVDLSLEWAPYPAARAALANTLELSNITHIVKTKAKQSVKSIDQLSHYLTEGVLHDEFVLENLDPLLHCIRSANVVIRWTILHSRMQEVIPMMNNSREQRAVFDKGTDPDRLITLLLQASQLEWKLKQIFSSLLASKEDRWQRCMKETSDRLQELSEYFTGEKPLTRVERNEDLMTWFKDTADKVKSLDYVDHVKAGRRIKRLIEALVSVEQFDQIDTSLQVKAFLAESRQYLTEMVRTVRVRQEAMGIIETVSDLSYGWEIINDFMPILHTRVKRDPSCVILLRALFLKLASILDVPLTRIHQCKSTDVISVAEYYSGELVDYVRRVMEIIPQSVFRILAGIIKLQTDHMKTIPVKIEALMLKNHAQLNERYRLARATNEVSKYTEGILAMKKTLLGILEVDPRQVLEEGLRKELVYRVSRAYHDILQFPATLTAAEGTAIFQALASTLQAYRLSFEYIQDYVGIYGLRMWHEELSRVINYNVEAECNRYLKKKIYDRASQYQSRAIPIPRFQPPPQDTSINFMGRWRLLHALFVMTDPHDTIYSFQCLSWFQEDGTEVAGMSTFGLLHQSVGLLGLVGIDRMLSFRIVHTLNNLIKFWASAVTPYLPLLDQLTAALEPAWRMPENAEKLYEAALKKVEKLQSKLLKAVLIIGQAALLRKAIAGELAFSSRLDAHLLTCTVDTLDKSLLSDVRQHYRAPAATPYPNPAVLVEVNKYLETMGANDPFQKIYITMDAPLEGLAPLFLLFVLAYMPKLQYDAAFGALKRVAANPLDGSPLVLGLLTIFKQLHPSFTDQLVAYLGQYVRAKINDAAPTTATLPPEVLNVLIFLQQFARAARLKTSMLHTHVPAYVFDAMQM